MAKFPVDAPKQRVVKALKTLGFQIVRKKEHISMVYCLGLTLLSFLVEESEKGEYEAKALRHSIYTQTEDLESLKKAIKDALKYHFEIKCIV